MIHCENSMIKKCHFVLTNFIVKTTHQKAPKLDSSVYSKNLCIAVTTT